MAKGILRRAMFGAASALESVAGDYARTQMQKSANIDLIQVRAEVEALRDARLHELKTRNQREIGGAISAAGQPVTETGYDAEGNAVQNTHTPTRAEQLSAGERRALELGEIEAAGHLSTMAAPKLTKIGQDETILNDRGEVVFRNTAGDERREREATFKHGLDVERDKKKSENEARLRLQLESFKLKNGSEATTAMMKNINFMTKNGIADDAKSAFDMLRTSMSKPDDQAALDLAKYLMRGSAYRGRGGQQRALDDASEMVVSLRGRGSSGGSFSSADDVRSAYRAGRLSRDAATRELRRFGYE